MKHIGTLLDRVWRWLINDDELHADLSPASRESLDWYRFFVYLLIHIACLGVLWVGVSWEAVALCVALYLVRMFFVTGFYHRYFSHRTFQASRAVQFAMAFLGCTGGMRGPLWWAGHHRHHHQHSDETPDVHSPCQKGFWRSHALWFLEKGNFAVQRDYVRDWMRFPELVWLERLDAIPFLLMGGVLFAAGSVLESWNPEAGVTGWQFLVWGFFLSTVLLHHGTFTINSLAHRVGRVRFATNDDSRNSWWLALLTLGEGWHNNHHHYPSAARQGFYWWEVDPTYYLLKGMEKLGVIGGLRPVPERVLARGRQQPTRLEPFSCERTEDAHPRPSDPIAE